MYLIANRRFASPDEGLFRNSPNTYLHCVTNSYFEVKDLPLLMQPQIIRSRDHLSEVGIHQIQQFPTVPDQTSIDSCIYCSGAQNIERMY